MRTKRVEVAAPESLEDHPVSGLRALEELGDVERRVGGQQSADSGAGGWQIGEVAAIGGRLDRRRRGRWPGLDSRVGVGRLENRLLCMPGALAEHAVQAKADEERNQRENDDDGQRLRFQILIVPTNIMRARARFKARATSRAAIAPNLTDC